MFKAMDKYRLPAQILLGAIGISFIGFGLVGFETPRNDQYIVQIGDQAITRRQVDEAVQMTAQAGGNGAARDTVFQTLVSRAYLLEGARSLGLTASDSQIKQMIVDNPEFHNADKKFDPALFQSYLANRHISEEQFMSEQRDNLTVLNMMAVLNNYPVSDAQVQTLLNTQAATRTLRSAGMNPAAFAQRVKTDDAALKKFYDANKKNYMLAQAVKFEYVVLSPKDLAEKQKVEESELKQALAQSETQSIPKRRLSHILISTEGKDKAQAKAEAEKIAAEAKANPDNFAELAKKHSQDEGTAAQGGDLGEVARNGLGEDSKAVEDAAFALAKGEVSGVLESKFGYHIVKVTDLSEEGNDDARRAAAEKSVKERKAQQAFAKMREELGELAFAHPNELKTAADKLGLNIQKREQWFTRADANSAGVPAAVVEALFVGDVFDKKMNSEVISANGEAWVVRAVETRAETAQSFDTVKEQVKEDWVRSEAVRLAKEEAKKLLAQLQAGKTAEMVWSPVQTVEPAQLAQQLPPQAYRDLMSAIPRQGKPAYALIERAGVPEIVEVQSITAPKLSPDMSAMVRNVLMQAQGEARLQAYINSLNSTVKSRQGAEKLSDSE